MRSIRFLSLALLAAVAGTLSQSAFATVPYTEHFTTDAANWVDSSPTPTIATWVSSGGIAPGGPDTGYVTSSKSAFGLTNPQAPPVVFYGQDNFDSSNDQFTGDWLASGINHFSTYVWHDAPSSLNFFVRFAAASNFPGTIGLNFTPVAPNTWTKLDFVISPGNVNSASNPTGQFLEEGPGSFTGAFSAVGNIQVGFLPTQALTTDPNTYHFALDQPSISTPEPASWMLALGAAAAAWSRRRRVMGA